MKLTVEEKITIKSYNEGATEWGLEHGEFNFWETEFETFSRLMPKGKILEIGCGGGRDARALVSKGYDYIGTDAARGFVELCKKIVKGAKFFCRSVYDLKFQDSEFDGFWASAVFLHIPKKRIDEALSEIKRVIKPGGIGFISIKEGEGEKVLEEDFVKSGKKKRFWAFYTKSEFDKVLERNKFEVVKFKRRVVSERTKWLIFFVKV